MLLLKGTFRGVDQFEFNGNKIFSLCVEEKEGTDWKDMKVTITRVGVDKDFNLDAMERYIDQEVLLAVKTFSGKKGVGYNLLSVVTEEQKKKLKIA